MKKSEIWYADLNPRRGKEQSGAWPVLIISGNAMNDNYNLVIICPLTSIIKNLIGCVLIKPSRVNGLKIASEVLTFHIRCIAKDRLIKKIGTISNAEMDEITLKLNNILKY